jgi:hypothetical protein
MAAMSSYETVANRKRRKNESERFSIVGRSYQATTFEGIEAIMFRLMICGLC